MFDLRQFIDIHLLCRHRLERVKLLRLGCAIEEAVKLYGEPIAQKPFDEAPQITEYTFSASPYHEAVVHVWEEKVQSVTYWSAKSDPGRDLTYMLTHYQDDSRWDVMEKGYWYQRVDGKLRLWCSAIPALGIAYVDFLQTKKRAEDGTQSGTAQGPGRCHLGTRRCGP